MSLAVLRSRALAGMEAPAVSVEVHLANGLPGLTIVGLVSASHTRATPRKMYRREQGRHDNDELFQTTSAA
jgi:hypothetical protein